MTIDIVLPAAAAKILGYSDCQMRVLRDNDVIEYLVHRVNRCGGEFYIRAELIAFCRRRVLDRELAETIEFLIGHLDDDCK